MLVSGGGAAVFPQASANSILLAGLVSQHNQSSGHLLNNGGGVLGNTTTTTTLNGNSKVTVSAQPIDCNNIVSSIGMVNTTNSFTPPPPTLCFPHPMCSVRPSFLSVLRVHQASNHQVRRVLILHTEVINLLCLPPPPAAKIRANGSGCHARSTSNRQSMTA